MTVLALILGFGLLARLILNMRKQNRLLLEDNAALSSNLKATRSRAAALIRRTRRQRDAYASAFTATSDEFMELGARTEELESELRIYRSEDIRRHIEQRVWS